MHLRCILLASMLVAVQGAPPHIITCPSGAPNEDINECSTERVHYTSGTPLCGADGCQLCGYSLGLGNGNICEKVPGIENRVQFLRPEASSDVTATGDVNKRVTFFVDGGLAWPDISNSIFSYVPDFAYGYDVIVPEWQFPGNRRVTFTCPIPRPSRGLVWDGCTAFVYQYRCPGCTFENGGLPKFMMDNSWEPSYCAPQFRLINGGHIHNMVTFRKSMAPGESVNFDTSVSTEFIAWHGSRVPVHCERRMTMDSCHDTPNHPGICTWDHNGGVCRNNDCKRNYGPSNGSPGSCTHCTNDEIDARGDEIMQIMVQNDEGGRRR